MDKKVLMDKIRHFEYKNIQSFYLDMQKFRRSQKDVEEIVALIKELGQDKPYDEWVIPKEYNIDGH